MNEPLPITITTEAVKQIKAKVASNNDAIGLRLTIGTKGCSGKSYDMEYVTEEDLGSDDKIETDGAVLYIPKIQSWMLMGLEIGYKADKLESGFVFNNPNEAGRCGCGESFTLSKSD